MTDDDDDLPAFAWHCDSCDRFVAVGTTRTVDGVLVHVLPRGKVCGPVGLVEVD